MYITYVHHYILNPCGQGLLGVLDCLACTPLLCYHRRLVTFRNQSLQYCISIILSVSTSIPRILVGFRLPWCSWCLSVFVSRHTILRLALHGFGLCIEGYCLSWYAWWHTILTYPGVTARKYVLGCILILVCCKGVLGYFLVMEGWAPLNLGQNRQRWVRKHPMDEASKVGPSTHPWASELTDHCGTA
jgi:hypothetical protein